MIVTNHSYLVAHAQELGATSPLTYLVVDEAQHLSRSVLQNSRDEISFQKASFTVNQLQTLISSDDEQTLAQVFDKLPLGNYNIELMRDDLVEVHASLEDLQQELYGKFLKDVNIDSVEDFIEQPVDNEQLRDLLSPDVPLMMRFEQALASLKLHFTALEHLFRARMDSWLSSDRYIMNQVASQMSVLLKIDEQLRSMVQTLRNDSD